MAQLKFGFATSTATSGWRRVEEAAHDAVRGHASKLSEESKMDWEA
jgi:hypothetical protein